jgi:YegS/Rv2252/BmrU family lipid kinase
MQRPLVILNPAAGRGRARRAWPAVERELREVGIELEVVATTGPGDAARHAERAARQHRAVIAAGGDGTVHEVVNGLLRASAERETVPLGVVPLGSGDDFAKLLRPGHAAERLARNGIRRFDAGRIRAENRTCYFANGMDVGFGAHAARNVGSVPRFFTGLGAYLGALGLTVIRYPNLRLHLRLDDGPVSQQDTTMAAVMNGRSFGGSFHVTPDASPEDGWLDLMIAQRVSRARILQLVPKIMRGSHAGEPDLRMLRARRVLIDSDAPLVVEADGQIVFEEARRLEIEVRPGVLAVID